MLLGGGGGFKTGIRVKPGIRVSEDGGGGGGSEILYLRIKELFFFPCPCLTPIVSDIQYDLKKCKKLQKTCGESALSHRASPAMPHHLAWVRYCVLINAILLR